MEKDFPRRCLPSITYMDMVFEGFWSEIGSIHFNHFGLKIGIWILQKRVWILETLSDNGYVLQWPGLTVKWYRKITYFDLK